MTQDLSNRENVIAVTFPEDTNAYQAMTLLKQLDSQHQVELAGAAVVVREEDGHLETKDIVADPRYAATTGGGLLGLLIGILGGPLGVLIGGATGVMIGSLFDLQDAEVSESALAEMSKSVQVARPTLLADVTEQSTEVIDTAMAGLGGAVLRRSVDDVAAEIASAEEAQRKAKMEARNELLKARHEEHKEKINAKVEELKGKLQPHKKAAVTTS